MIYILYKSICQKLHDIMLRNYINQIHDLNSTLKFE